MKKFLAMPKHICLDIAMTSTMLSAPSDESVKTGRRPNPSIDGPRDNTVCFMLSDGEKLAVDRLAFCLNITRSGLLAKVVAEFVAASSGSKAGREAEKRLRAYLEDCRMAFKKRGAFAVKTVGGTKGA
jgi:hypothetical protein